MAPRAHYAQLKKAGAVTFHKIGNYHGTMAYTNGDMYIGKWKDGKRHGWGSMMYGKGTFTDALVPVYTGEWKDGERHGQGTMAYADGSTYSGEWKDGEPAP